jgi:hypothetical protein
MLSRSILLSPSKPFPSTTHSLPLRSSSRSGLFALGSRTFTPVSVRQSTIIKIAPILLLVTASPPLTVIITLDRLLLLVLVLPHPVVITALLSSLVGQCVSRSPPLRMMKTVNWTSLWISYTDFRFGIGTTPSTMRDTLIISPMSLRTCPNLTCANLLSPMPS